MKHITQLTLFASVFHSAAGVTYLISPHISKEIAFPSGLFGLTLVRNISTHSTTMSQISPTIFRQPNTQLGINPANLSSEISMHSGQLVRCEAQA
jgi:hypothetical protein